MMNSPLWRPSKARVKRANLTRFIDDICLQYDILLSDYTSLYRWSIQEPEHFWSGVWDFAGIVSKQKGTTIVKDFDRFPGARWFPQARLNFAENLLQQYSDQDAIIFQDEVSPKKVLSHAELYNHVSRLSQALQDIGVRAGDRVGGILTNSPEAIIAMLAASSIGAIWTSCSPDFGASGIVDRLGQLDPKVVFAVDGYFYNGKCHRIGQQLDQVLRTLSSIEKLILVPYAADSVPVNHSKAVVWDEFIDSYIPQPIAFEQLPFAHPLYILYSSGTTGAPKCIVHSAGGTLIQHVKEHLLHVDVHPNDRLFYFTTCGWMMWNWLVSGLASKATLVLYDGSPFYPNRDALFSLIEHTGINIFGVSAKFLDVLKKYDSIPREKSDLSSLDTILSTGSPLVSESYNFVYKNIKSDVCLSSISGGTDIIGCFAAGSTVSPVWRGEIQCRALGMKVEIFDEDGNSVSTSKGELVCTAPFPSVPIGFWNDQNDEKFHAAYFAKYPNIWCHGDFAELTEHDGLIIYGRSDAVLNPGGVRIGTAEIYRQVEQIDQVMESLVIGQDWRGDTRIVLFVQLRQGLTVDDQLVENIKQQIRTNLSVHHVPAKIIQIDEIPYTKSGKKVELAVRDVVNGRSVPSKTALANPKALDAFKDLKELQI